jgi:hypothetical protein
VGADTRFNGYLRNIHVFPLSKKKNPNDLQLAEKQILGNRTNRLGFFFEKRPGFYSDAKKKEY